MTIKKLADPLITFQKWLGIEIVEISRTEKLIAATGGGLAILVLFIVSGLVLPTTDCALLVICSMGASAVLLFAMPHGQLSQPWSVIAGHCVSAAIGIACARFIPVKLIAIACAVCLSIGAMLQLKCLHPPGGATALTAVLGGSTIQQLGFKFVLFPVMANAVSIVLLAVLINFFFKRRRYPAVLVKSAIRTLAATSPGINTTATHAEILAAIKTLDTFIDITEEDLLRIIEALPRGRDKLR